MKRLRAILECILLLGIVYLIYEIMYFAYNYIIFYGLHQGWEMLHIEAYTHLGDIESITLEYVRDHPLEYTLLSWLVVASSFLIVAVFSKQKLSQIFALRQMNMKNSLASMVTGIGLVFLMNGLIRFISAATDIEFSYLSSSTFRVYNLWFLMVIVGILTPIFEELFFRGVVLSRLSYGFGPFISIILSSVVFSLSHMNLVQSIYVFPVGLLAAILVYKTGSILSAIWLHTLYNILNIYLAKINFFQYNSVQLLILILIGISLLGVGLYQSEVQNAIETP
ncbi:CPBP family intramembrane glutamic endopeptidase [Petrocella sp. FN5]|uniref:CPBP family intramembrane glutamic endopeptidase n=1 Tax=Petrocella sp. FN5 TaxID=3032002 RepID=UPI0023DC5274|nr:CPBP family intramembrane glutamic endopeptidase [Petrocella sp. FN5]MDF1617107.1 CPBP family intramembrane metalloprotease [Petrocella sp. FN5]